MKKFEMAVCPAVIRHRPEFQAAAEKGKAVLQNAQDRGAGQPAQNRAGTAHQ